MIGALVLGACVVLIVAGALSWYHTVRLENELKTTVLERLRSAGFDDVGIRVEGQDVILTGEVDARVDRRRMLEVAASVEGVADVRDERTVTNYASGRHFELHSYAGITTVEGELPDPRDIELVLSAIRGHYGVDALGADLDVHRAVRRPPWLDRFAAILDALGPVSPLQIRYHDDTLVITGDVADHKTRTEVTERVAHTVGEDARLEIHLQLPDQILDPSIRIVYRRGGVSVSGEVPDDDFAEQLVAALALAFAVDDVENELRINPDIRHSSWLEGVLRVVFPLAMTSWVDFEIGAGEVTVRGSVRGDDELEILKEQVRDNFDYAIRVVNLIRSRDGDE